MKLFVRILLAAGLVLLGIAFSATVSAAPADVQPLTPLIPVIAPNAQGCNGTPVITSFWANPPVVSPGQVSTLQWGLVANANAAFLQTPGGTQGIGTPGSRPVKPGQTTTYNLIAYCGNNSAQASVTVNVQNAPGCQGQPIITSFTANPTNIQRGQSSTLQWGPVNNADAVVLSKPDGNSGVGTPGAQQVQPGRTQTYTLTAWCKGRSVSQSVTVNVQNAPPPPPPPPSGSRITGANVNGGLTKGNVTVVTVNYFWDGTDAPATMQGTPYGGNGQPIGGTYQTRIDPNRDFRANMRFTVPVSNIGSVNFCIVGSSGTELACRNWSP